MPRVEMMGASGAMLVNGKKQCRLVCLLIRGEKLGGGRVRYACTVSQISDPLFEEGCEIG